MRFEMSEISAWPNCWPTRARNQSAATRKRLGVELEVEPLTSAPANARRCKAMKIALAASVVEPDFQRLQVDADAAPPSACARAFKAISRDSHRSAATPGRVCRHEFVPQLVRAFRPGRWQRHARQRRHGLGLGRHAGHRRNARRSRRLPGARPESPADAQARRFILIFRPISARPSQFQSRNRKKTPGRMRKRDERAALAPAPFRARTERGQMLVVEDDAEVAAGFARDFRGRGLRR